MASEDKPLRRWEASNAFSVRSTYKLINDGGHRLKHLEKTLERALPVKSKDFLWLVGKNTVLTWNNLQCRG